jgi:hypothetical protein
MMTGLCGVVTGLCEHGNVPLYLKNSLNSGIIISFPKKTLYQGEVSCINGNTVGELPVRARRT